MLLGDVPPAVLPRQADLNLPLTNELGQYGVGWNPAEEQVEGHLSGPPPITSPKRIEVVPARLEQVHALELGWGHGVLPGAASQQRTNPITTITTNRTPCDWSAETRLILRSDAASAGPCIGTGQQPLLGTHSTRTSVCHPFRSRGGRRTACERGQTREAH